MNIDRQFRCGIEQAGAALRAGIGRRSVRVEDLHMTGVGAHCQVVATGRRHDLAFDRTDKLKCYSPTRTTGRANYADQVITCKVWT